MDMYMLCIDQGTSGTKTLLVDTRGQVVKRCNKNHGQFYPHPGWVEHDAMEIFDNILQGIDQILESVSISPRQIAALSIANQRETIVVWDKNSGLPVSNAIVWQCNRASEICHAVKSNGCADEIHRRSGLILSPYYSAAKAKWLLDNVPGARRKADNGDLLLGTIDSWLIYKLTGGKIHATDTSNASRTQLMNLESLSWDKELLRIFNIPECMMPQILHSDDSFGFCEVSALRETGTPITGIMGDSHAALFGQNCFSTGMTKATYGTGTSIMMNIGGKPYRSQKGLVTSVGWTLGNKTVYVAEGNINSSASTIKWMVDDLELIPDASSSEAIASSVESSDGVYLVPAFVGLGTPYWNSEATALLTGMTRGTKKAHVVRAALESIAFQVKDIIDIMEQESGITLQELRVDGGATRNALLMQMQADILQTDVLVNDTEEISALGSAFAAGLSTGVWSSLKALKKLHKHDTRILPKLSTEKRDTLYSGWQRAVLRCVANIR